ncbi:MAG TPA: NepR family anti-sigma factor [Caulobacterales bacterium]|nr:NepR family anti-sigma factor [Caulobacterales bacterium]
METLVSPNRPSGKDGKVKKVRSGASTSAHKALIARNLRLVYDEVAGEPVPERILELLAKMDKAEDRGRP